MNGQLKLKSVFDGSDCIEYVTDADIERQGETVVISYAENQDDYAETTSKIGISKDVVTLNRFGSFPATFLFSKGQTQQGKILTLVGEIDISINTYALAADFDENCIKLSLGYEMIMQGAPSSVCLMELECSFKE